MGQYDYVKHTRNRTAAGGYTKTLGPVNFLVRRIPDCDWEIVAHCPGAIVDYIDGFKNEHEATEWISGSESRKWIEDHGFQR